MHIAILTRQIGHYHNARYSAALDNFDKVSVIEVASEGGFAELLATNLGAYDRQAIYLSRSDYELAQKEHRLSKDVADCLNQVEPDVIAVAGWASAETAAAIRWARQNECPVVIMSESQPDDASRSWLREKVKAQIVNLCDAALVGGPSHETYIQKLGMPKDKISFGYNAVDNAHFAKNAPIARENSDSVRSKHDLPNPYFLGSARFIEKKNFPALIAAHGEALLTHPDLPDLAILGDGPYRKHIEDAISRHPDPIKVKLLGFKVYSDLPELYGLASAFIHVSTVEQWGLVINEAMSSATPVIVSDRCGASRTVVRDGISGIISGTSVSDITKALNRFMELSQEERAEMALAAQEDIEKWSPQRFGTGLRQAAETAHATFQPRGKFGLIDEAILKRLELAPLKGVA